MGESKQAKDCILFSTADWDEPYWTNKQHVANELVKQGWRVLYVESVGLRTPVTSSRRDWRRLAERMVKGIFSLVFGAKKRGENIWTLSPLMLPAVHQYKFLSIVNKCLLKLALVRALIGKNFRSPIVWTYHAYIFGVLPEKYSVGLLIYHCVDDLSAVPGINAEVYRRAENELLTQADTVFTTSIPLTERCIQINKNTHYYPNVVDFEHFSKALDLDCIPSDLIDIPEPRLCYHGVLSDFKLDFNLLFETMSTNPDWNLVLIGEEREGQKNVTLDKLKSLANVYLIGYRPYSVLPEYLRGMNVGLLPNLLNDYTRSMYPMKYFEYQAAGLPVVSTSLDFAKDVNVSGALLVGNTVDEFSECIELQLKSGKMDKTQARESVGNNTWTRRTLLMLEKLGFTGTM